MSSLESLRVLVTRPGPQGKILCEKIEALGGFAIHFPALEFAPPTQVIAFPPDLDIYDWIIFISPRAVAWSADHLPPLSKKTRVAAIGEGTANSLRQIEIKDVICPAKEWTSEGLLALPVFKKLLQQKILLIRGEGGRDTLATELTARGATVDHLPVYRRVMPIYAEDHPGLVALRQKKIDITVCTSGESLHNLMSIVGTANQPLLRDIAMVVISERLAILAQALCFREIILAKNASIPAMIDTLCLIKGNAHVRSHSR